MAASPGSRPSPARTTIAIGSGKGGVGKSTVSLNLAVALAHRGAAVGLADADVYGPDIPRMVGIARSEHLKSWTLWKQGGLSLEPVERFGIKLMSAGFLIAEDQALAWEARMIELALHQLLHEVAWGPLDYLVIDLPPGTADLQQRLTTKIPLTGAVVVVTPQDVAHLDAKRLIAMYRRLGVAVLGGIENMSGLICPCCDKRIEVFPRVAEPRSIWAMGIEKLGEIPMEPGVAHSGDAGLPALVEHPDSPSAQSFRAIADQIAGLV